MSSQFSSPTTKNRETPPDLPRNYGVTRLVLMPRDPLWMHAYWEVADYTWREAEKGFGPGVRENGRAVLRLFPVDNGLAPHDVSVDLNSRNWYTRPPARGGGWRAELGILLPDGRFVLLALSNTVQMPNGDVSDVIDEKWGILKAEWQRLFELSGGGRLGAGSLDITKMLAQRWQFLKSVSSWAGSFGSVSSWSRPKNFWLKADCEVIVYGATEPDAALRFQGKPIRLNPDGTFTFRFQFPDGQQSFPIEAVNRDGDLSESIEISVRRVTKKP